MTMLDGGDAFSTFDPTPGGYSPATRTVGEVFRQVKRTFGDESGVQLEDADLIGWVNDAQDEIVKRNKVIKSTATATSVEGRGNYGFPADDILQIESLHVGGHMLQNITFAQAEIDIITSKRLEESGPPALWWEWGGVFTIWPYPADPTEIKLYYTKRPARVSSSSDTLTLSDKYFQEIVTYVLQQAYEMDEDWQASATKGEQFNTRLLAQAEDERTAQHMTYSTLTQSYEP